MTRTATSDPETRRRKAEALERIKRLQARVSARNRDLSPERAEEIAEELNQAATRSLRERGEVTFERDKS